MGIVNAGRCCVSVVPRLTVTIGRCWTHYACSRHTIQTINATDQTIGDNAMIPAEIKSMPDVTCPQCGAELDVEEDDIDGIGFTMMRDQDCIMVCPECDEYL